MTVDLQELRARAERCRIDEIEVWPPDVLKLIDAVEAARDALEQIMANAESWHGPEPDMGHVRALGVISTTARTALAALYDAGLAAIEATP